MPLWISFGLIGVGILAIFIEIFVPAAGLIGLGGGGMIIAGVVLGYVYHDPIAGTIVLFTALIATPTAIVLGLKTFPKTPMGRRLILGDYGTNAPSRRNGQLLDRGTTLVGSISLPAIALQKGDEGEAVSVLRPSGTARFGKLKVSVVTSGEYIERGVPVRVVRVEGNRVVVRKAPEPQQPQQE
jgi:membrane-bound serine protease (ClpP class)